MLLAHAVGALFDPLQNVEGRGEIVGPDVLQEAGAHTAQHTIDLLGLGLAHRREMQGLGAPIGRKSRGAGTGQSGAITIMTSASGAHR
jgi:hypothetical protein